MVGTSDVAYRRRKLPILNRSIWFRSLPWDPSSLIRDDDNMVMVTTVSPPTPEKQTHAVGKGGRVLPKQPVRAARHGGLRGRTGEGGRRQKPDRRLLWWRAVLSLGQLFVRGVRWNRDQPSCGGLRHA